MYDAAPSPTPDGYCLERDLGAFVLRPCLPAFRAAGLGAGSRPKSSCTDSAVTALRSQSLSCSRSVQAWICSRSAASTWSPGHRAPRARLPAHPRNDLPGAPRGGPPRALLGVPGRATRGTMGTGARSCQSSSVPPRLCGPPHPARTRSGQRKGGRARLQAPPRQPSLSGRCSGLPRPAHAPWRTTPPAPDQRSPWGAADWVESWPYGAPGGPGGAVWLRAPLG